MRRICAWCKLNMGDNGDGESGTTHGICQTCYERMHHVYLARGTKPRPRPDES